MSGKKHDNEPRKPAGWNRQQAQHLLSRAGFGGSPAGVEALRKLGREGAVDHLLRYPQTARSEARPTWVREPWVDTEARLPGLSREEQTKRHVATRIRYRQEMDDLRAWWLKRMVKTEHPLQEKLVLFWHWHFPTAQAKVFISQAHFVQNELYRTHAAGNFRTLVRAVTLDPGMLLYLDGNTNTAGRPNENYARELMELFTLGIGSYTEPDVREGARALSGWKLEGLTPRFQSAEHDAGDKTFLGRRGALTWEDGCDACLAHAASAPFLCGKLVRYFGVADPQGTLTARLAHTLQSENWELTPVLRELLLSPEFYSEETCGSQIKCPVQLLVGALRALEVDFTPTLPLVQALNLMGQDLFNPPNVKGWLTGRDMITTGTLMARYHLADLLVDGRIPDGVGPVAPERQRVMRPNEATLRTGAVNALLAQGQEAEARDQHVKVRFDPAGLFPGGIPEQPERVVGALTRRLLVQPASPPLRKALVAACSAAPAEQRPAVVTRLLLASPEFQVH